MLTEPGESGSAEAREVALKALRYRDHSALELEQRLATRGIPKPDRDAALATLIRTGLVDDRRFAEVRATSLAARGAGDLLIRERLARAGVAADLVAEALAALEPEVERARIAVGRRSPGPKTARYLFGKGFTDETVAAIASGSDDELG